MYLKETWWHFGISNVKIEELYSRLSTLWILVTADIIRMDIWLGTLQRCNTPHQNRYNPGGSRRAWWNVQKCEIILVSAIIHNAGRFRNQEVIWWGWDCHIGRLHCVVAQSFYSIADLFEQIDIKSSDNNDLEIPFSVVHLRYICMKGFWTQDM